MGGQVVLQPGPLGRADAAATGIPTVGVEGDQVPGADIEAVVALAHLARGGAKVIEIRLGPGWVAEAVVRWVGAGAVLMVAYGGVADRLDPAPGRAIEAGEVRSFPALVLDIPQDEDGLRGRGQNEIR